MKIELKQNKKMNDAKKNKNDEFYTQLSDIEKEVITYHNFNESFKDKIVYCNCDDPEWSNFYLHFKLKFKTYGLKKLITTYIDHEKPTFKLEFDGKNEIKTQLRQNGDFRSPECIEILKESDIVVTNPPFSLFRKYMAQLMEYNKQFLIIGNMNALTYKEIFPLIKENKVWLGKNNGSKEYQIPNNYNHLKSYEKENGKMYTKLGNTCWFTNLEHPKRKEEFIAYRDWNQDFDRKHYEKYTNFDAIEVSKGLDIPKNYDGIMGVPITFIEKLNPTQFEIIGNSAYSNKESFGVGALYIDSKKVYARVLIKWK